MRHPTHDDKLNQRFDRAVPDGAMRCISLTVLAAVILLTDGAAVRAQTAVGAGSVRPPSGITVKDLDSPVLPTPVAPDITGTVPAHKPSASPSQNGLSPGATTPEIITDLSRLPPPVARMRERILAAARSGELDQLVAVMRANNGMPIFSLNDDQDPAIYWRSNYPDSGGVEILAMLVDILETGFVHVDKGTPQEMYLWPYFARVPLKELGPEQKVELFKIVTGSDYKDMLDAGTYNFYRVGIGADGTWRFFVTGD